MDVKNSPIYTSEPMATRALAAEIRRRPDEILDLVRSRSGRALLGEPASVRCEAVAGVDVLIEIDEGGDIRSIGIEAKFDHELTEQQIAREHAAVDLLVLLVTNTASVPPWLAPKYPDVPVITWAEALACFRDSRITVDDVNSIKVPKVVVEARLHELSLTEQLPGWKIDHRRNGNGNPAVVIQSPVFGSNVVLRGQIQVVGRGMPDTLDSVRLEGHIGVAVAELKENYFDPDTSDAAPAWIEHLRTLQREVLAEAGDLYGISRRSPGRSSRELGRWKTPLAKKHLREHAYLAKGYTDGWAIGPKTRSVPLAELDELAARTAALFSRWFEAENQNLS
jgi:hypothetical protein